MTRRRHADTRIVGDDGLTLELTSRDKLCGTARRCWRSKGRAAGNTCARETAGAGDASAASIASLPVGLTMGYPLEPYTADLGREHLDMVREERALYDDGASASAYMLRRVNYVLAPM